MSEGRITRPEEMRPAMRPDPRSESLRRAEARAKELRARPLMGLPTDVMNLDKDLAPEGWTYQFKRDSVYGQPDKQSQIGNRASGWEPVPPDRHPDTYIPPDGVLMEKPTVVVDEAHKQREKDTKAELRSQRGKLTESPIDEMPNMRADRRAVRFKEDWMAVRPGSVEEE